jgi:hypothetical protein
MTGLIATIIATRHHPKHKHLELVVIIVIASI